jgi:hypothetical protein
VNREMEAVSMELNGEMEAPSMELSPTMRRAC